MPLLVDTGVLYALADRRDSWHQRCVDFIEEEPERLLVPVTVLPEVAYLLHTRLGAAAEVAFINAIAARELDVESLKDVDVRRAAAVMERHPEMGFVDATLAAIAERLKLSRLATTDRRHFAAYVPPHRQAFELVP
jgi:uncharacterized protein